MVFVLQNEGLDENNEHNIDMAKFDDIVNDLKEVKEYLENPIVKEVFVCPQEYLPTENAIDFNPTQAAHDNAPLQNRKRNNSTGMIFKKSIYFKNCSGLSLYFKFSAFSLEFQVFFRSQE